MAEKPDMAALFGAPAKGGTKPPGAGPMPMMGDAEEAPLPPDFEAAAMEFLQATDDTEKAHALKRAIEACVEAREQSEY